MLLNHGIHLGYCTNIHSGETWEETWRGLKDYTLRVKDRVSGGKPYGIGLWLSEQAARELSAPGKIAEFKNWLEANNSYVFTINGFPYGSFHGTRVKEQVFKPDWSTKARLEYTNLHRDAREGGCHACCGRRTSSVAGCRCQPSGAPPSYSPPSFGARYLDNPKPAYPMLARRRGLEGTVRLEVRVSAEGIPTAVKVRESAGHDALDDAATTAVWHWRFVPARRDGEAVEGVVVVPIRFRLGEDEAA